MLKQHKASSWHWEMCEAGLGAVHSEPAQIAVEAAFGSPLRV